MRPLALFVGLAVSAGSGLLAVSGPGPLLSARQDATPRSEARLVSDVASVRPGEPFTVGLHVTLDEGWRTPWKNAGDVGSGLLATWTLPGGFSADSFAYPIPERIADPPVASYGYHDEVVFLATITPPADLETGRSVRFRLSADFVVCGHTCIPVNAERSLELPVRDAPPTASDHAALVRRYADRLPVEHAQWTTRAARTDRGFVLGVAPPADWEGSLRGAWFFPADPAILDHAADQPVERTAAGEYRVRLTESAYLAGEPERIQGVLVLPDGGAFDAAGHQGLVVSAAVADAEVVWAAEPTEPVAVAGAAGVAAAQASTGGAAGGVGLLLAVLFALVGGVILNLMPCVFPILSLKALGFAGRGGDRAGMRRDGLAFAAGVVVTFLAVAGLLMAVRASGAQVGWGYQLQSTAVVAALAALMFVIGLILAGVFEVGVSLTRLGGLGGSGEGSAFLMGVLSAGPRHGRALRGPLLLARAGPAPAEAGPVDGDVQAGAGVPDVRRRHLAGLGVRAADGDGGRRAAPVRAAASGFRRLADRALARDGDLDPQAVGDPGAGGRRGDRRARGGGRSHQRGDAAPRGRGGGRGGGVGDVERGRGRGAAQRRPPRIRRLHGGMVHQLPGERARGAGDALGAAGIRGAGCGASEGRPDAPRPRHQGGLASFGRSGVPLYVYYPAYPAAEPVVLPALLTPAIVLNIIEPEETT